MMMMAAVGEVEMEEHFFYGKRKRGKDGKLNINSFPELFFHTHTYTDRHTFARETDMLIPPRNEPANSSRKKERKRAFRRPIHSLTLS